MNKTEMLKEEKLIKEFQKADADLKKADADWNKAYENLLTYKTNI